VLEAAQALDEPVRPTAAKKTKGKAKGKALMKPKRPCSVDGCVTLTARYGLCSRHGGADKCKVDGCLKVDRGNGFCTTHDPEGVKVIEKVCKVENCGEKSSRWGLCVKHGGVAKCKKVGCSKNAQGCGHCAAHGGGYRCKVENCTKYNQGGGFCMAHGGRGKKKACKIEGCGIVANLFGLCLEHGGVDPRPDSEVVPLAVVQAMMQCTNPPARPISMPAPAEEPSRGPEPEVSASITPPPRSASAPEEPFERRDDFNATPIAHPPVAALTAVGSQSTESSAPAFISEAPTSQLKEEV
jgi:hypothetical protein